MMPTVLVVDDEPDMLELTLYQLRQAGYRVLTSGSGCEALKQAQRHLPDLILLDIRLPDLDGRSVCELLRCLPSTRHIPVLLLTAMAGDALPGLALRSGARCLLRKPVDFLDLLHRVREALGDSTRAARGHPIAGGTTEPPREAYEAETWGGAASEPPFSNYVLAPWMAGA